MINKTQLTSKSKTPEPSLEEYLERLSRISGESKPAGIMRWLGVSPSSYSNWVRRGTIPYKTIVSALLARNISLNWFFAPYSRLEIPPLRDESVREGAKTYLQQKREDEGETDRLIKAYSQCQALLESYGAEVEPKNMKLMLDLYFEVGERVVSSEQVLNYLAQSLASGDPKL